MTRVADLCRGSLDNAPYLQEASESPCFWNVARDGGNIRITLEPSEKVAFDHADEVRLKTDAGLLVGTDKGEWGGSLSLIPTNGLPAKVLLSENVRQLVPVKSGILVFTGRLDFDKGSVWL